MLPLPDRVDEGGVLRIPQSSSITGTSLSECFVSYPGHSLGRSLTAPANWANNVMVNKLVRDIVTKEFEF